MKNSKNNFRIFVIALAALFAAAGTNTATAIDNKGNLPVSVKYVGAVDNAPVFQLSFTNEKEEQYEIKVMDATDTIYTETVKGKGQVRKYQFVNNGNGDDVLLVQIRNTSTNAVITYKINPSSKVEAETELVATL
jgi:Ca2+-binding RTX toxin-like protein